ncbi:MAG: hypothetical protein KAV82_06385 [Phycisphaerae bacterium]|nr:hypothetical protein [Phycisphaerae bacterium]
MNVVVGNSNHKVNIPVDCVIQPKQLRKSKLPILIEALQGRAPLSRTS